MTKDLWMIEWQDHSGESDHDIKEAAASPEDAALAVRRILDGETSAEDDSPAFDALFEGEDPVAVLRDLRNHIEQNCGAGTLTVTRTTAPGGTDHDPRLPSEPQRL